MPASPQDHVSSILDALEHEHPDAHIYLEFDNALDLLIRTILAAQCTDAKVNEVAPKLWKKYPTASDIANADRSDLEDILHPTGFYRRKSKSVQNCCQALVEDHDGRVPSDLKQLTDLPGVGRKTANVVLAHAMGKQAIPVDTHVKRVSRRIGLATKSSADAIERELCKIIPQRRWTQSSLLMGTHGRRICDSRNPDCENCPITQWCQYYSKQSQ